MGGSSSNEGNVYALNPDTGVEGPVCDDTWDMDNVIFSAFIFDQNYEESKARLIDVLDTIRNKKCESIINKKIVKLKFRFLRVSPHIDLSILMVKGHTAKHKLCWVVNLGHG